MRLHQSYLLTLNGFITLILFLTLTLMLGCGGGGGGGNNDDPDVVVEDNTPDLFSFTAQTTVEPDVWIESNTITVTGIDNSVPISILVGEYSIDGGAFTANSGSVALNQSVTVRVRSPADFGFSSGATLIVGDSISGVSARFDVTTNYDSPIFDREANLACIAPANATTGNAEFQIQAAFPQLPLLSGLVGLFQKPNDSSLWHAMQQSGQVLQFDNDASADSVFTYLDIRDRVLNSGEQGLLGMAFHPQFSSNGEVYVSYTNTNGDSVISRFVDAGSLPVNANNETILLTLEQPAANHNGGHIAFGPDGYLYIGFGDGGGGGDTFGHGQNTQSLHGAMLRLDVSGANYAIPADNPFVTDANVLDEIYAYGLRNPWRWSFDQQNGDLWVADVGQELWEEVNLVTAGNNLGWPIMEGNHCFQSSNCDQTGLTLPVAEYAHGQNCSITGGFVYRGQQAPGLQGQYLYGDYCSGWVYTAENLGNQTYDAGVILLSGKNIASFAQGNDGEVYLLDHFGNAGEGIYRFVETGGDVSNIPANLSETGCFDSTVNKTYSAGVVPYDVRSELWSDGVDKTRFLALPDGVHINVGEKGDFNFPLQSVLVKNFIRNGQYLETRLFMRHTAGWAGYSYRWLDDQTDAILVDGDDPEIVSVGNFEHIIPSRGQCFICHTGAANTTLGLESSQQNIAITYSNGNSGNQVGALLAAGYLSEAPAAVEARAMAAIDDQSASLETRARSYLHSNCGGCHREGAAGAPLDLTIHTTLENAMACDVAPTHGDLGINDARIIAPGNSASSVLLARMQSLDAQVRMPPLASQVVDDEAVAVIAQWIDSLAGCN